MRYILINIFVWLFISALFIISKRKFFQKAWEKWRKSLVPIYDCYIIFKIWWHKKWILWILFPPVLILLKIVIIFDISKKFGKSEFFAIWLWLLPIIFYPILAFWKAEYDRNLKKSWKSFSYVIVFFLSFITFVVCAFIWNLYHPWNKNIDKYRLKIQIPIMKSLSDYLVLYEDWKIDILDEKYYYDNDPETIALDELTPYLSKLQRWDIVFANSNKYISSFVIPWKWKHVFIYLWSGEIIDATSKWVLTRYIVDIDNLKRWSLLTDLVAFRPNLSDKLIDEFLNYVSNQVWKPYDFEYDKMDDSSFYCSELVEKGLEFVWIYCLYESESIWKKVVSPEDIVRYIREIWIKKWEFKEIFSLKKKFVCNKKSCLWWWKSILVDETL